MLPVLAYFRVIWLQLTFKIKDGQYKDGQVRQRMDIGK